MKIAFIGAGNVAWNLSYALHKADNEIVLVINKTLINAQKLAKVYGAKATDRISEINQNSIDLIIVCTRDGGYKAVAMELITSIPVVHTSGSISIDILKVCSPKIGVFYPLQSMTQNRKIDFSEVPICIESNDKKLLFTLKKLADSISKVVLKINSEQRKKLHLGAIFASNFSNFLYILSKEYLRANNLPEHILDQLISETANRIIGKEPADFQTGPARRGDVSVIKDHLNMLDRNKLMKDIYKILSQKILEKYDHNSLLD